MTTFRGLVIALMIASGGAVALPAAGSAGACDGLWSLSGAADVVLQDDAYSGRDAGDEPTGAVPLTPEMIYSWGFVAPPAEPHVADAADWYAFPVDASTEVVMLEVIATAEAYVRYEAPFAAAPRAVPLPDGIRFGLEAWAPGASSPTHVGVATAAGGANATFVPDATGVWHARVFVAASEGVELDGCGDAAPEPPGLAQSPVVVANYGVYYGCRPGCVAF